MNGADLHDYIERVRDANPVLDVVSADADVRRKGALYWCRSPLRKERTASFCIYADQNTWWDYGTGTGVDVFDYIQQRDNLSFWESVLWLAERAGLPRWQSGGLDDDGNPFDPKYERELEMMSERRRCERIVIDACKYMHSVLRSDEYRDVVEHLNKHYGIRDETIDKYLIGWCDTALYDHLRSKCEYSRAHILQTGLFIDFGKKRNPVGHLDSRIIFPYWSHGRIVYTIGRRFEGRTPNDDHQRGKYKKQRVFHAKDKKHSYISKSIGNDWFWGEDSARRKADFGIVTEGITDAISCAQEGIPVLSPVTTQFREQDIGKLTSLLGHWGFTVLVNDHESPRVDERGNVRQPGLDGAKKTCAALIKAGRDVRLLLLPKPEGTDKIDLNEYLRDHGKEQLLTLIKSARPYIAQLIDEISTDLDPVDVEQAIRPVCELLAYTSDLQRDLYVEILCKRLGVRKRSVQQLVSEFARTREDAEDELDPDVIRPKEKVAAVAASSEPTAESPHESVTVTSVPPAPSADSTVHPDPPALPPAAEKPNGKKSAKKSNGTADAGSNGAGGDGAGGGNNGFDGKGHLLKMWGEIFESRKGYYFQGKGKTKARLSNFVIEPRARILTDRGQRTLCDLVLTNGRKFKERILPENTFNSARDFNRVLQSVSHEMAWSGINSNVAALVDMLAEIEVPEFTGVHAIGYHETPDGPRWICPEGVIGPSGFISGSRYIYDPSIKPVISSSLDYSGARLSDETTSGLAQKVLPDLFALNTPDVILSLVGWYTASLVAPFLRKRLGHFPVLWVWGTGGSGKTSLNRDIFWPAFSGVLAEPFSCSDTTFAQIVNAAATNAVANVNDEFKNDLPQVNRERVTRIARRSYTMEVESRGRPDRTMDSYLLSAPQVYVGEMIPEEPALRERLIVVSPMKTNLTDPRKACMRRLMTQPLVMLSGSLIRFLLRCDLDDFLATARAILGSMLDTMRLSPRIMDNLLCIVFGDLLHQQWCKHLGVVINDRPDLRYSMGRILANITDSDGDDSESDQVRDMLDQFVKQIGMYAHLGIIEEGVHYCGLIVDQSRRIYLYTEAAREAYLEACRKTGQTDITLSNAAIKRVAREKSEDPHSWLVERSRQVFLGKSRPRCIGIDVDRLESLLGASFPVKRWKHHGGAHEDEEDYDVN